MQQTHQPTEDLAAEIARGGLTLDERLRLDQARKKKSDKIETLPATLRRVCDYLEYAGSRSDSRLTVSENLAAPLVNFAWNELSASTDRFRRRLLSAKAVGALQRSLGRRLARTGEQAAHWEILAATAARNLSMDLPPKIEPEFCDYFFSSGVSNETLRFLRNYPALARLWAVQIEYWSRFVQDFLRDANAFARCLGGKIDSRTPIISGLETDLSDPHEGNRTVVRVRFGEGREWFYKPRRGLQERAWFELLRWVNARGFPRPFQVLSVVCKDRHCWMESVRPRQCRNQKEAAECCFRIGALMCLIHVLRGVDFHPANIVAAGDQPVVIDCETLLHPATALPAYARGEDDSVARTGMLTIVRRMPAENVVAGFRAMHGFLRRRAVSKHLRNWTNQLRKVSGRDVYRPSAHYYKMIEGSLAPSLLASGLDRSLYLRAACGGDCNSPRRMRAEAQALQNVDIPVFRSKRRGIKIDLSEKTLEESISMIRATAEAVARSSRKAGSITEDYQGIQVHR
jgi:lantibiotic modifying enzyme